MDSPFRHQSSSKDFCIPAHLHVWLLALIAALMLLPGSATIPLIDRDEPRFAHAAQEMNDRGNWIVPYFNNEYRFDKPPLSYWWMGLHYRIFGENEFAARLHSMIATFLVAWLIYGFGKNQFSAGAGFMSALAWLTCLQVWVHGRFCLADMPLIAAIIASQWATWELISTANEKPERKWFFVLYTSLALGFLAKGPIIIFVFIISLLLYRYAFRQKFALPRLQLFPGITLTLAIIAIWGIPALLQTKGAFWDIGMGKHVVQRGVESFNSRIPLPFYYFLTAFFSIFPWIPLAWDRVVSFRKSFTPNKAWLLSCFFAPYLIFSFYATQLPHYTMPGFPAFFLFIFSLANPIPLSRRGRIWLYCTSTPVILLALFLASVAVFTAMPPELIPLRITLLCVTGLLIGYGLMLFFYQTNRLKNILWVILALAVLSQIIGIHVRQLSPVIKLADAGLFAPKTDASWHSFIFTEPSLVFYSDTFWTFHPEMDSALAHIQEGKHSTIFLKKEYRMDDYFKNRLHGKPLATRHDYSLQLDALPKDNYTIHSASGINFARSSWVELQVFIPKK